MRTSLIETFFCAFLFFLSLPPSVPLERPLAISDSVQHAIMHRPSSLMSADVSCCILISVLPRNCGKNPKTIQGDLFEEDPRNCEKKSGDAKFRRGCRMVLRLSGPEIFSLQARPKTKISL